MFKIYNLFKIAVGVVALVTLAGCGGGGGRAERRWSELVLTVALLDREQFPEAQR